MLFLRRAYCLVAGHIHSGNTQWGWSDIYCEWCGERTLTFREAVMENWEFCNKTAGCTLENGHGGDCRLAKGV